MDREEILKLIVEVLSERGVDKLPERLDGFETLLKELSEVATKQEQAPETEEPVDDTVSKRIELLEKQLKDAQARDKEREKALAAKDYETTLTSLIQREGLMYPKLVNKMLKQELQGAKLNGDFYLLPDGRKLEEAVNAFFETDEGKHFLKPSNIPGGSDIPTPDPALPSKPDFNSMSLEDMINDSFGI